MPTFTMSEFIEKNELGCRSDDPSATKLIARKLREAGYKKLKLRHNGTVQNVWTNEQDLRIEALKAKLALLKL